MSLRVIKVGGSTLSSPDGFARFVAQIKQSQAVLEDLVIVHGGGPAIAEELENDQHSFEFHNGVRITREEMLVSVRRALWDRVNQELSSALSAIGIEHRRVCGFADKALLSTVLSPDLGRVGIVKTVDASLSKGITLLCPLGVDSEGKMLNVNADYAASEVASQLAAESLVFLSDQSGLLGSDGELLPDCDRRRAKDLIQNRVIVGGMHAKVEMIFKALKKGCREVVLLDGRLESSLSAYLQHNELAGTRFRP